MSTLELDLRAAGEQGFELALTARLSGRGVTAVYGPSGSGKSTLLEVIAGLRKPDTNSRVSFRGETWTGPGITVPPWQRGVGLVFQDARLFPHLDVAGNLTYAEQRAHGQAAATRAELVDWLGLSELLQRRPETLSAGQKQRVAICRALLNGPELLLLDEPLANLDHRARRECLSLLQQLADRLDLPMLYVTHDIEEVSTLADHILLLDRGKLVDQGSMLAMSSRLDNRLSHQEQAAAILLGEVSSQDDAFGLTEIRVEGQTLFVNHLDQPIGSRRRLRIPARDVSICRQRPDDSSILNILPVTISEIEDCSDARLLLRLALGEQHLLARITRKSAQRLGLAEGEQVFAQIKSVALLSEADDR